MVPFDLAEPRSLSEAIALLDRDDPAIRPIAGGTALMLMMKAGCFGRCGSSACAGSSRALRASHRAATMALLRIGAMATSRDLEHSPDLRRHAPVIARTMRDVANVRVRNVATVGGNLAHADPHLDLPPVWIALGAQVVIAGAGGAERTIPVEELFVGYYETILRHDELIAEMVVPPQPAGARPISNAPRARRTIGRRSASHVAHAQGRDNRGAAHRRSAPPPRRRCASPRRKPFCAVRVSMTRC